MNVIVIDRSDRPNTSLAPWMPNCWSDQSTSPFGARITRQA